MTTALHAAVPAAGDGLMTGRPVRLAFPKDALHRMEET